MQNAEAIPVAAARYKGSFAHFSISNKMRDAFAMKPYANDLIASATKGDGVGNVVYVQVIWSGDGEEIVLRPLFNKKEYYIFDSTQFELINNNSTTQLIKNKGCKAFLEAPDGVSFITSKNLNKHRIW